MSSGDFAGVVALVIALLFIGFWLVTSRRTNRFARRRKRRAWRNGQWE